MKSGKLIIFSAPSGSGKTTIIKQLLQEKLPLEFSISACNRLPRAGEQNGIDYHFLSTEEFQTKIKANEFIEWEEVYPDRYYGTLKSELTRIWKNNNQVLFDIDVVGGINLKSQFEEAALSIFIQPPSIDELKNRLLGRATDSTEEINKRIAKAEEELSYSNKFDITITNGILEDAVTKTVNAVNTFLDN